MRMLVLVCAVALMVQPAVVTCNPHRKAAQINLNILFDVAKHCQKSATEGFFVQDVSSLSRGVNKCEDKFFCKVEEIVTTPKHFCERSASEGLVGYLKMYNQQRNVNCTQELQGVSAGDETVVFTLLEELIHCIRLRNFRGT